MNTRLARSIGPVLGLSTLLTGCVCFPFATPPLEVSAGIAPTADDERIGVSVPIDISAKPAGAFERFWDRNLEFGVGYRVAPNNLSRVHHGPTMSAGYLLPVSLRPPVDGQSDLGMRFGFTGQGNVLVGNEVDGIGYGATFRFTTEWVRFDNGEFDSCTYDSDPGYQDLDGDGYNDTDDDYSCSFGYSFGELGIGLFAEASWLDLGTRPIGWIGFGLTLRVPAAAGIAVASILD